MTQSSHKQSSQKQVPVKPDMTQKHVSLFGPHSLLGLRHELDTLFDGFFSGSPFKGDQDLMPRMDVNESEKTFALSAELPGMTANDIDLSISDGQLIIKGEKKEEQVSDEDDRHLTERHYGSIYRALALPRWVDENSIQATYDNGVLKVTLQKGGDKEKGIQTVKINAK